MYRVYSLEEKKWLVEGVYMSPFPHTDLYRVEKNIFGKEKLHIIDEADYVCHRFIDLYDKNSEMVFEGDIIEAQVANDITVTGIVTYAKEYSSYVILCFNPDEFYVLGDSICQQIEVVGNVFDNPELIPEDVNV